MIAGVSVIRRIRNEEVGSLANLEATGVLYLPDGPGGVGRGGDRVGREHAHLGTRQVQDLEAASLWNRLSAEPSLNHSNWEGP